jgi:hypothetical protein
MPSMTRAPVAPGSPVEREDLALAQKTMRRVSSRLVPFLFVLYICNFLDRTNVGMAKLQMGRDLPWLSDSAYGLGVGIFFLGYALLEVPSNLILARVGARRWIARIMISWGLVASAMALVRTPVQFLLAAPSARGDGGGVLPRHHLLPDPVVPGPRARASDGAVHDGDPRLGRPRQPAQRLVARPRRLDGTRGVAVALPDRKSPVGTLGIAVLRLLPDRPADAGRWLSRRQRARGSPRASNAGR